MSKIKTTPCPAQIKRNSEFAIELVPGSRDLEEIQAEMLQPLAKMIAETIRRALNRGTLTIIGNHVQFCGKIEVPHGEAETG